MAGRNQRMVLGIESMEPRDLPSGLAAALKIGPSEVALPRDTDALDRVATHEIEHANPLAESGLSGARGPRLVGESHRDAIGGHGRSGRAHRGDVQIEPATVFDMTKGFTVSGLNPASTGSNTVYYTAAPQPTTTPASQALSQVTVTTKSWDSGRRQLLDLSFQRVKQGTSIVQPLNTIPNALQVGRPGKVVLNLTPGQKVNVSFFMYFTTQSGATAKTRKNLFDTIDWGGRTPAMFVADNPLTGRKVFFSKKEQKITYSPNNNNIDWADYSCCLPSSTQFFNLSDLPSALNKLELAQSPPLYAIHFDAVVSQDRD